MANRNQINGTLQAMKEQQIRILEEDIRNIARRERHQQFIIDQLAIVEQTGAVKPWVQAYLNVEYKPKPDDDPVWLMYERLNEVYQRRQAQTNDPNN